MKRNERYQLDKHNIANYKCIAIDNNITQIMCYPFQDGRNIYLIDNDYIYDIIRNLYRLRALSINISRIKYHTEPEHEILSQVRKNP
jgi:hypothetical protein